MSQKRIAIIEDDSNMRFFYKSALGRSYELDFYERLADVSLTNWNYQLTIADMVLPDGILSDSLPELFALNQPVLIVSSLDEMSAMRRTRILGGVDYLVKPLTENELLFKVENILSRECGLLALPNIEGLTPKEEKILQFLSQKPDRGCSRRDLQDAIWRSTTVQPNTLEVHLSNLRKKILPLGYTIVASELGEISLIRSDTVDQ